MEVVKYFKIIIFLSSFIYYIFKRVYVYKLCLLNKELNDCIEYTIFISINIIL